MMENVHSIENEKILSQSSDSIQLEFTIPASSDFFDGHFPEFKLLPAVAQFEVVTRFAKKYFGTQRFVPKINRIKFSAPIRPDATVQLKLDINKETQSMSYSLWDANNAEKVYSSGTFSVVA
ncbi:MAG: hydroxymyristoyl-ACP dehydratase [Treponema sp.]|nr:hydroxymyristoyl-ACP dehydratase [Treponema sp.]